MAFRADEQSRIGREHALDYLLRNISPAERKQSQMILEHIIDTYGPVIQSYPSWHPLMSANSDQRDLGRDPTTTPDERAGYKGLDHTIYLRNAFITCPYHGTEEVLASVKHLQGHRDATISAEALDIPLYNDGATPVLVKCEWNTTLEEEGTVPKQIAVGLFLEQEVPCWRWAQRGETWENMRHYILGAPRGSKSSLFVNQETGNALKTVYLSMLNAGLFGPIKDN